MNIQFTLCQRSLALNAGPYIVRSVGAARRLLALLDNDARRTGDEVLGLALDSELVSSMESGVLGRLGLLDFEPERERAVT